jgi:redox-sensitive bicupin YhaK (pirin superfamily)
METGLGAPIQAFQDPDWRAALKKSVSGIFPSPTGHWVGDGFPVRSLFTYDRFGRDISPFLLLDYAGPAEFTAAPPRPRGVGEHPHRGFETVTLVYQGEVAHRDSAGNSGVIGVGDVQWMTAASGILHDEFHSPAFTRSGGVLEMVQLWVNLPARHKMAAPRYQTIVNRDIPRLALPHDAGSVRIIAGNLGETYGPAGTFSPLNVWDLQLQAGGMASLPIPAGHIAALAVLRGRVSVNASALIDGVQLLLLGAAGDEIHVLAAQASSVLVLSGIPIAEPIVGHGPFVMNTREEIVQAMRDFQTGKFGQMPLS